MQLTKGKFLIGRADNLKDGLGRARTMAAVILVLAAGCGSSQIRQPRWGWQPGRSQAIITNSAGQGWSTYFSGGTGSVTITTLTPNHAVGTFSFDAVPAVGGAVGTLHVTNGRFDVTY